MSSYIRNYVFLSLIILISTNAECQLSEISIKSNSFFHFKAKETVVQDADLQGSFLVPRTSVTHEVFLNTALKIKNKYSIYIGLGVGYVNSAYRVNTTNEFLNSEFSQDTPFRFSSQLSNYFALKTGLLKDLHQSENILLQLFFGARVYYTEPGNASLKFSEELPSGNKIYTTLTSEITNPNNQLGYNIDLGLIFQKKFKQFPIHWNIGLNFSQALTELWSGNFQLIGDTETYTVESSNKLSFIGLELGLVYKFENTRNL